MIIWTYGQSVGVELSQDGHPIAYESRKLTLAELKYDIYEKELTTVIHTLKIWKYFLIGNEFIVETDHQSLKYFLT